MPLISPNESAETLLKTFAASGDNAAFTGIVRNHASLVYSTALRLLGEHRHLADDVTQTVFTDLAAKARTLPTDVPLAGWLHQHACFVARKALRTELRRLRREDTAHAMNFSDDASDALWLQVRPLLDDALGELPDADRHALVLRFLQGRPFKSVAETLATSEDAARMRVGRALDRLREVLAKRGVLTTSDALDGALANYAVIAAPAALIAVITASTATAAVSTALPFLTAMKAAKVAVAALVVAGGVLLVRQHQENARLRDDLAQFRSLQAELDNLQEEKNRLAARVPSIDEVNAARRSLDELQKLRGQVSTLQTAAKPASTNSAPQMTPEDEAAWADVAKRSLHSFRAQANTAIKAGDSIVLGGWETKPGRTLVAVVTPSFVDAAGNLTSDENAAIVIEGRFVETSTEMLKSLGLDWNRQGANLSGVLAELEDADARKLFDRFAETKETTTLAAPKVLTNPGRPASVSALEMKNLGPLKLGLGPWLNVRPTPAGQGRISLAVEVGTTLSEQASP